MVFKKYPRAQQVFSALILFGLLAACSVGSSGGQTETPKERGSVQTATLTPTQEQTPSPSATQIPPTKTAVPASPTVQMIQIEPGLNDLSELETLKAVFNQDAGRTRMILLLSTGCPSCLVGAHWIDQNLLRKNPGLDLQVYAIWFSTVPEHLLSATINPMWEEKTLTDPRVTHFWDPRRAASNWLAANQEYEGPQRSALARTVGGLIWSRTIWDTYFLYGPQAEWSESLSGLMSSAYPIAHHWDDIRQELGVDREPVVVGTNPTTYRIDRQESLVTYEVSEVLVGQDLNNAIGVTQAITGTIELNTQDPRQSMVGVMQVDISTLSSDNWLRDDRLRKEFLQSNQFPLAVFTPRELQGLPSSYTPGEQLSFDMIGDLDVRETPVPVAFQVTAEVVDGWLVGSATTILEMTDFGFDPPELGAGLIKADSEVTLRVDFVAKPASN